MRQAKSGWNWGAGLVAALGAVLLLSGARAEEPPAGSPLAWAQEALDAGRYKEAVEQLRKALAAARAPDVAQASSLQQEGRQDACATASLRLAAALRTVGEYEEALRLCDAVLQCEAGHKAAGCLRGELLTEVGNYEDALKVFDALIAADPRRQRAWAMRKRVAAIVGRAELLKQSADHFFELFNSNAEKYHHGEVDDPLEPAYVGIGIQEENPKDAFEVGFMIAEELIQKRGLKDAEALVWAAQLAFEKYSFDFAHKRFTAALRLRPRYPDALTGLAQVLLAVRNDQAHAEPMLREALEVNPRHIDAHLALATLALQDDDSAAAREHIEAALAVNPNHLEALAMLAFYHHDLQQLAREAEVEKRALAINPKCADYYCTVGQLLESKRGFDEAPAYYRKAIELDPQYWRGYYGLGMNTSRQGAQGEEEGKQLLLKAFEMNKFNLWAANMVKILDKVIGDKEQAVAPVYSTSRTAHFVLKFHSKEADVLRPYLEEWAEAAYARQVKLFGFEPRGPLSIEICFSFQDQAARTVGVPNLGALGVCFGKLCTVVSPREGKGGAPPFNWRRTMEHEFGHVMALQLSAYRVPRWYTEGLSVYLEEDTRLQSDQMMVDALAKGQLKPLEKMNEYFKRNMLMAYVHGRHVIEYVIEKFGFEAHNRALKLFAAGKKTEQAMPEATGKSLEELNAGQLERVKEYYRNVRLRPSYDQADMARLELTAAQPDAAAQSIAELARAHLRMRGMQARAAAEAQRALEKDPQCAEAHIVLGLLAYARKDYTASKASFEKAVQAAPEASFAAWRHLGIIYKKEGRTTKAIQALEKARDMYPRYAGEDKPRALLPELYLDLEPPQEARALAAWREAAKADTEDAEAPRQGLKLAMKLAAKPRTSSLNPQPSELWAAAAEFAMLVFEVDPYDVETHRKAGRVYEELKDLPRAAREYRVATALAEKDVDSWVNLARVELARNDREAAGKALQAALDIDAVHEGARALRKQLGL